MKSQHQIQKLLAYFDHIIAHPAPPDSQYTPADHERSLLALDILSWVLDLPCNMDAHFTRIKASFNHDIAKHN